MTISGSQNGTLETSETAHVARSEAPVWYVGISLEHFGEWYFENFPNDVRNQIRGFSPLGAVSSSPQNKASYGAKSTDTAPSFGANSIIADSFINNISGQTGENVAITNINLSTASGLRGLVECRMNPSSGAGWIYDLTVEIETDLPIFETDADLMVYCNSRGEDTSTIKNVSDPEEDYAEMFDYWWIKAKWGHNTRNTDSNSNITKNYRFYPKRSGICFVAHKPTAQEPWDRVLTHYSGYDAKYSSWGDDNDEDYQDNPNVTTHFLSKNISFGANDYYTSFNFSTNIPLWKTQQDADDYYAGLKDISDADNYDYLLRQDASIAEPDMAGTNADTETDLGENGMAFTYGSRLYAITNIELSSLFTEVFQPANVQAILDGTKLFGSNNMECISGIMYIPLNDLSEICELGSLSNIIIASWTSQNAQGKRIQTNKGTINCGSFFYNPVYHDFRDFEPYNLLFYNGPFVGMHQLTISKYLNKTVEVHYNIDVCTGAIVCSLLADGILIDVFDGTCGASRPFNATDNNAYINNIISAITGASSTASGSIEGITNSVGAVEKATSIGAVSTFGATLGAVGVAGGIAGAGIYTGYEVKSAVDNPPQMHRGSLAGNLAYSLNTKPTFLCFSKKVFRPENELETIGYPSGHGGSVGSFSGFLAVKDMKLANGFIGSNAEMMEILDIVKNGIYL
jgi:hypothetical protein